MTFEEAKKILKKEGFYVEKATRPCAISESFIEYEDPTICEAMQVISSAGYFIYMEMSCFDERKARLKKEYGKSTKAPGSGEEQSKEKKGIIYPSTSPKADFYYKHVLNEGNPALKEAASQFNDALLDEQAKKIKRLGKEISRLNGIIHDKNEEIKRKTKGCCELVAENVDLKEDLRNTESLLHDTREANSRNLDMCFKNEDLIDELKKKLAEKTKLAKKYAKELSDSSLGLCKLEKQLKDKNAVLSDVAEELRLTKIREKNLAKLGLKYVGENEKLKKELADKVVDKIDAQALKSAESALAYKEKVIAEKDEVVADLGNELAATKKELEDANKLVKTVRKYSKEYREYGIEAVKMIRKMAKVIVNEGPVSSKDFKEYRRLANGYRFNPQLPDFSEEEEKKLTAKMVDINAKCMRAARESINDVFESYAAKYAKSTLDELKDKAYESFNAKAHKLGLVGSKDGKGIPDQMIRVDIAEEGGDQSVTIVQCDNGIILSKEEAEIIERCTKNGTELHYSKKDGLTYTNMFGEEMPIRCLRGMFHVFTDEEIENMKK